MKKAITGYLEHLKKERHYSPHTLAGYGNDLSQLFEFLRNEKGTAEIDPGDITQSTLRHYLGDLLEQGLEKKSVARKLAATRSWFKYLVRHGVVRSNPAVNIVSPKLPKKLPVFLAESCIQKMMDLPDAATDEGIRDRAVLEILYGTGMRLSELVGLTLGDIDLANCTVKVEGKGRKQRILPLGTKARLAVKNYLAIRSGFVSKDAAEMGRGAAFLSK